MMKKILFLLVLIPGLTFGQIDIAKREIKVDSLRARVDSLWMFGPVTFKQRPHVKGDSVALLSEVGGSMIYPGVGIPLSTGSAWGTSLTNNSDNWNTAFSWGNHASAGYITATQARSDIHDSIANIVIPSSNPADSVAYSTAFPFNKAFTLMKHTLTDNDIITVNVTNKIIGAGGQILFKNNATNTPILSAFHVSGVYDNTLNYSLCTFIYLGVVSGSDIYVCSIINFN